MTRAPFVLVGLLAMAVLAPAVAASDDDEGFFVFLDATFTTPGNTDQVVGYAQNATANPQTTTPLAVDWGAGSGSAVGLGYSWGRDAFSVRFWQFDDDETLTANGPSGGFTNFAIGPATYLYGYYVYYNFGAPGRVDFDSTVEASTIDLSWSHTADVGDSFDLEWSLGLRFASFEEDIRGEYDICASGGCDIPASYYFSPGDVTFAARKSNDGDMTGFRAGVRGRRFFGDTFAVSSEVGFAALTGEVVSESGLRPTGAINLGLNNDPATFARVEDDERLGMMFDLGFDLEWYLVDRRLRLALGYEHSMWSGIAEDLLRNTPGLLTPNKDRDSVTFSGFKLGVRYRF